MHIYALQGRPGFAAVSLWLILLLFLFLMTSCERTPVDRTETGEMVLGSVPGTVVETRGVVPGGRRMVLEGFSGNIHLRGTDDPLAALSFQKQARGEAADEVEALLSHITIQESGDGEQYLFEIRAQKPQRTSVDVTGTVPRGMPLEISLQRGTVHLEGLEADLVVHNQMGSIRITGARGAVAVTTQNGNIAVEMSVLPGDVRLETINGDVALGLPPDASAKISAQTTVGAVRTEDIVFIDSRLDPSASGARFTGRLGSGRLTVSLKTENGSVILSPTASLAPVPAPPSSTVPADSVARPAPRTASSAPPSNGN